MNRKALIVAINAYPTCPLRGCINDGNRNANELVNNYGFDATNVRLLFDERATTAAVLDRLGWLCQGAEPGDLLAFLESRHGALFPTRDANGNVDRLNAVACYYDFDWTPERMVSHTQFVEIFSKLPRGMKLFWLSDSCHSGAIDREMPRSRRIMTPKSFPIPHDVEWGIRAARAKGHGHDAAIREFVASGFDVAFVPGCKPEETSSDTEVDGVPCGALTHYFWDASHALPPDGSVKAITDLARENLGKDGYEQHPVADGTWINEPIPR